MEKCKVDHNFRVNRVNYHYTRSIYVKVFLWIIILLMLVPSKYLELAKVVKTLVNSFENTYYKRGDVFSSELHP